MRPPRGDVRDHVDSHESDHRLSYPFYGAVQPQSYLEVRVRENFGAARFSTFSTVSANTGRSCQVGSLTGNDYGPNDYRASETHVRQRQAEIPLIAK